MNSSKRNQNSCIPRSIQHPLPSPNKVSTRKLSQLSQTDIPIISLVENLYEFSIGKELNTISEKVKVNYVKALEYINLTHKIMNKILTETFWNNDDKIQIKIPDVTNYLNFFLLLTNKIKPKVLKNKKRNLQTELKMKGNRKNGIQKSPNSTIEESSLCATSKGSLSSVSRNSLNKKGLSDLDKKSFNDSKSLLGSSTEPQLQMDHDDQKLFESEKSIHELDEIFLREQNDSGLTGTDKMHVPEGNTIITSRKETEEWKSHERIKQKIKDKFNGKYRSDDQGLIESIKEQGRLRNTKIGDDNTTKVKDQKRVNFRNQQETDDDYVHSKCNEEMNIIYQEKNGLKEQERLNINTESTYQNRINLKDINKYTEEIYLHRKDLINNEEDICSNFSTKNFSKLFKINQGFEDFPEEVEDNNCQEGLTQQTRKPVYHNFYDSSEICNSEVTKKPSDSVLDICSGIELLKTDLLGRIQLENLNKRNEFIPMETVVPKKPKNLEVAHFPIVDIPECPTKIWTNLNFDQSPAFNKSKSRYSQFSYRSLDNKDMKSKSFVCNNKNSNSMSGRSPKMMFKKLSNEKISVKEKKKKKDSEMSDGSVILDDEEYEFCITKGLIRTNSRERQPTEQKSKKNKVDKKQLEEINLNHPFKLNEKDLNRTNKQMLSAIGIFKENGELKPNVMELLHTYQQVNSKDMRNKKFRTKRKWDVQIHWKPKNGFPKNLSSCSSQKSYISMQVKSESDIFTENHRK